MNAKWIFNFVSYSRLSSASYIYPYFFISLIFFSFTYLLVPLPASSFQVFFSIHVPHLCSPMAVTIPSRQFLSVSFVYPLIRSSPSLLFHHITPHPIIYHLISLPFPSLASYHLISFHGHNHCLPSSPSSSPSIPTSPLTIILCVTQSPLWWSPPSHLSPSGNLIITLIAAGISRRLILLGGQIGMTCPRSISLSDWA